ncbi:hypothetical protein VTJ04DRAFT_10794 [Mycothermus thermophilus]|uniref:uncharacterized protein n=1 Tax=Humicola insolens TaxID=85995 RepID=UPI003743F50B
MVNLYEDPFAYDGTDFNPFLGHDQFPSPPSPEEFHVVSSATEPNFPPAIHHALKGSIHHPGYLSPADPLGPAAAGFDDASLRTQAHLPRSVPPGFQPGPGQRGLTIDTAAAGLSWNAAAMATTNVASPIITSPTAASIPTTRPPSHPLHNMALNIASLPDTTATTTTGITAGALTASVPITSAAPPSTNPLLTSPLPESQDELTRLITTLRSELRQAAQERDEARLQLSEARNELYAAKQIEKRLRVERDEARSHAEFLGQERVKLKQTEARLRRERNEARLAAATAAAAAAGLGGKAGRVGLGLGGVGVGLAPGGKRPGIGSAVAAGTGTTAAGIGVAGTAGQGAGATAAGVAGGGGGGGGGNTAGGGVTSGVGAAAAGGTAALGVAAAAGLAAAVDSQGEESGESPPMAMDQS